MTVPIYSMADTWNAGATTFQSILMNVTNGAAGNPVGTAASELISLQTNATERFGVRCPHFSLGTDATPFLNLSDIWNTSATITGLKYNVTDTASNAASLLADFQKGTVSQWSVTKGGTVGQLGSLNLNTAGTFIGDSGGIFFRIQSQASAPFIVIDGSGTGYFGWGNGNVQAADVRLFRDAANTLAQRNGTNAQTFRVYNTFTDASNYERGIFDWSTTSNTLTIGVANAGTGAQRPIFIGGGTGTAFLKLNVDSSFSFSKSNLATYWTISSAGHFLAGTDNTYDIGASGATRPRAGYFGSNIWSGTVTAALTTLTGAVDGFRSAAANVTQLGSENTTSSSATQGGFVGMYSNDGAAMASGDRLGGIRMGGSSSASALRNSTLIAGFADQNWVDASAYGSRLEFQTTTNGATTLSTKAIISNAGIFALGATVANTVPALKPSSTTLQIRLADDSDFTNVQGKLTTEASATTGLTPGALAALTTATIVIYDATGTAYRVPCVTP